MTNGPEIFTLPQCSGSVIHKLPIENPEVIPTLGDPTPAGGLRHPSLPLLEPLGGFPFLLAFTKYASLLRIGFCQKPVITQVSPFSGRARKYPPREKRPKLMPRHESLLHCLTWNLDLHSPNYLLGL